MNTPADRPDLRFPPTKKGEVLFVALGGCDEVGMNAYAYAYDDFWILVDLGLGFISDPLLQGIELKTIDPAVLLQNRDLIQAVFITHAHEDHIGALPLWADHLSEHCPIYASVFARSFLSQKLIDDQRLLPQTVHDLAPDKPIKAGPFTVTPFSVRHSIPEARGLTISTNDGIIIHSGDWKHDTSPDQGYRNNELATDFSRVRRLFADEPLLAFVCESTNAADDTASKNECDLYDPLVEAFEAAPRRLLATAFASNLERICTLMRAGQAVGRETCFIGRSLWRIWNSALRANLVNDLPQPLAEDRGLRLPVNKVLFVVTGCQGESRAILTRIAHLSFNKLRLDHDDTVVFSAGIIPGNEYVVFEVENALSRQGVYIERSTDFHTSGHAHQDDIARAYRDLEPQMAVTIHGEHRMLTHNARLAYENGVPLVAVPDNGTCIALNGHRQGEKVAQLPCEPVYLDGENFIPASSTQLLRRQRMAREGEAVISFSLDSWPTDQNGIGLSLIGLCDYEDQLEAEPAIVAECREVLFRLIHSLRNVPEPADLAAQIRREIRRYLFSRLGKRPEVTIHMYDQGSWLCLPRAL